MKNKEHEANINNDESAPWWILLLIALAVWPEVITLGAWHWLKHKAQAVWFRLTVRRICSWCKKEKGFTPLAWLAPNGLRATHGMCRNCLANKMRELDEREAICKSR